MTNQNISPLGADADIDYVVALLDQVQDAIDNIDPPAFLDALQEREVIPLGNLEEMHETMDDMAEHGGRSYTDVVADEGITLQVTADQVTVVDETPRPKTSRYANKKKKRAELMGELALDPEKVAKLAEQFRPAQRERPVAALLATRVIQASLEAAGVHPVPQPVDGEDHINVSATNGQTRIGKALDPYSRLRDAVVIEGAGTFTCLAGFMYYIGGLKYNSEAYAPEDLEVLRTSYGGRLSNFMHEMKIGPAQIERVEGLRLIMAHAYWTAISASEWLSRELVSTGTLELRAYYTRGDSEATRVSQYAHWLLPIIAACRSALQNGDEYPDFGISERETLRQPNYHRQWR